MRIQFNGSDLFIGDNTHVYPCNMGYWVDETSADLRHTDMKATVMDDFGNLVEILVAAKQRAIFRQALH